jgi:hypothetical protein
LWSGGSLNTSENCTSEAAQNRTSGPAGFVGKPGSPPIASILAFAASMTAMTAFTMLPVQSK